MAHFSATAGCNFSGGGKWGGKEGKRAFGEASNRLGISENGFALYQVN